MPQIVDYKFLQELAVSVKQLNTGAISEQIKALAGKLQAIEAASKVVSTLGEAEVLLAQAKVQKEKDLQERMKMEEILKGKSSALRKWEQQLSAKEKELSDQSDRLSNEKQALAIEHEAAMARFAARSKSLEAMDVELASARDELRKKEAAIEARSQKMLAALASL